MHARAARRLAADLDLEDVPTCPLCLLDLAWEVHEGRKPSRGLVTRTADWVWMESGVGVRAAVVRARMDEHPLAEQALRDLELKGWRSGFAEAVVLRLARELADEISARQ